MATLTLKHVNDFICYENKCLFHAISIENSEWPLNWSGDSKTDLQVYVCCLNPNHLILNTESTFYL